MAHRESPAGHAPAPRGFGACIPPKPRCFGGFIFGCSGSQSEVFSVLGVSLSPHLQPLPVRGHAGFVLGRSSLAAIFSQSRATHCFCVCAVLVQLESMVKAEEERQRAQKRIADALEMQKELLRQQRDSFYDKQARNAEKRAQVWRPDDVM